MNKAEEMRHLANITKSNYSLSELMEEIYESIHFCALHRGKQITLYFKNHSLLRNLVNITALGPMNYYIQIIKEDLEKNGFRIEISDNTNYWIKINWGLSLKETKGGLSLV